PPPPAPDADDGGTSRISLRVPEHLKPRIEEAAARDGLSVNAWLVRAVSSALEPGGPRRRSDRRVETQTGQRYTGWVR
ncbi:toxin-antitoxin system HicB family antitoxin, partial [Nonomuraea zeae]